MITLIRKSWTSPVGEPMSGFVLEGSNWAVSWNAKLEGIVNVSHECWVGEPRIAEYWCVVHLPTGNAAVVGLSEDDAFLVAEALAGAMVEAHDQTNGLAVARAYKSAFVATMKEVNKRSRVGSKPATNSRAKGDT